MSVTNHEYMDNIHLRELLFVWSFLRIFSMLSSFIAHFVLSHTLRFRPTESSWTPRLSSAPSSSENTQTQPVKAATRSSRQILSLRDMLCWSRSDISSCSRRKMAWRVWTSRRMFCAVCGASSILEMNRMTFLPASINPQIDATSDMGSMTGGGVRMRRKLGKEEVERTTTLLPFEPSFSRRFCLTLR